MKRGLPENIRIYIACGKTDMRKSMDGLSVMVSQNFKLNPFENGVFQWPRTTEDVREIVISNIGG